MPMALRHRRDGDPEGIDDMKRIATFALIAVLGIGAGSAAFADAKPAASQSKLDSIFASAHWDDDDDDDILKPGRKASPMPVPDADAIRRAGIVRVTEVERDDGQIRVEGFDAQGRKLELFMGRDGKRVLNSRVDYDWDD